MALILDNGTIQLSHRVIGNFIRLDENGQTEECLVYFDEESQDKKVLSLKDYGHDSFELDCKTEFLRILQDKQLAIKGPPEVPVPENLPKVGDSFKIIKGRKFALGTTGKVLWAGVNKYGTYSIKFDMISNPGGGLMYNQWVDVRNVEIIK